MDVNEVKELLSKGKLKFGIKSARVYSLNAKAKAILVAKNAKKVHKTEIENNCKRSGVKYEELDLNSDELGAICGKPFNISFITIIE